MNVTNYQSYYQQFPIPKNLELHQRRVASVINHIISHWDSGIVDRSEVIAAGLYHDMANIIKFKFESTSTLLDPSDDPNYWQQVQHQVIAHYGTNIHNANLAICHQLKLTHHIINTINNAEWDNVPVLIKNQFVEAILLVYADMRVAHFGIIAAKDRITNLATRSNIDVPKYLDYANRLEKYLAPLTIIDLQSINDESVILL